MLKEINLRGLFVVDAGTGAANTTLWLAERLKKDGGIFPPYYIMRMKK
jgi:tRNA A58 N-methylase Trm61